MNWTRLAIVALGFISSIATAHGQVFEKHVVVSQEGHASDIGRDVMRRGGNAVDAAVATALALAVTHPAAGNLGGGGFLVAYVADSNQVTTFDFRETAPLASTETMYLNEEGKLPPRHRAGPRAAEVPGTVRGLGLAHRKLGKLPWKDLVTPAVALAKDGFPLPRALAEGLNAQLFDDAAVPKVAEDLRHRGDRLADFPASIAAYRRADGKRWSEGDLLIQPDLAATLQRIAETGPEEFYTGETARLIVDHMKAYGGILTLDDLARYEAKERPPIHSTFRGFDVYGMGPPASGGILIALMLNILERDDFKTDGPHSARTLHRVTEAMRRGFFVRATRIADPDFVPVPIELLTSKRYAEELSLSITERATPSARLAPFPIERPEGTDTTHLSTMDGAGNAVALTYTLEEGYGSKAVVPGAGFLLNNEMGDFNLIPGRTDTSGRIGTAPNFIAPGKRMLSSQSPTIVLKDSKVRLVTGSPGGRTIPNTTLWVVLNVLEFGLDPRAAVDAPRTHHQWFPDVLTLEGTSWDAATVADLQERGHSLRHVSVQGDAHTIVVDPATGQRHGVADHRRETSRASGD